MSIIDDTIKRMGEEVSGADARAFIPAAAGDLGFVVGARKRRPVALLLALAIMVTGAVVYYFLPHAPTPAAVTVVHMAPAPAVVPVSAVAQTAAVTPAQTEDEQQGVVPPPNWYEAGWSAAHAGKWTQAFAAWEDGVRGLPEDRMVIVSSSYPDLAYFSSVLNGYVKQFPAVGIRQQHYNGQTMYRLLVFPYGGGTREVLPKVQALFPRAGLVNASRIQGLSGKLAAAGKPVPEAPPVVHLVEAVQQAATAAVVHDAKDDVLAAIRQPPAKTRAEISDAGEAVVMGDDGWENRSNAIRAQLKAESYAEAAQNAQALAHDFPERWEPWFWLGSAQLAQGQMDAADMALERAGKLNPKVAQIWVQRAVVAQEHGDHAAAIQYLSEARDLSPKSPQIYLNLGYSNDALGRAAEAEKNYLRFLSLTEGDDSYLLQRKPVINRLESRH